MKLSKNEWQIVECLKDKKKCMNVSELLTQCSPMTKKTYTYKAASPAIRQYGEKYEARNYPAGRRAIANLVKKNIIVIKNGKYCLDKT